MSYLCHTSRTASHSGRVHTFNSQEARFHQLLVDDRVAYRNKYIRHLSEQWTVRLDRPDAGSVNNPSARGVTTATKSKPQMNTGQPSRNPKSLTAETRVVRKNWNCALIVTSFIAIHKTHFIGRRLRPPVEKKIPATKDMGIWPRLGAFNEAKALQTPFRRSAALLSMPRR